MAQSSARRAVGAAIGTAFAVLFLVSGCSAGSETVVADVVTSPVASPSESWGIPGEAPDYRPCEELGPVYFRAHENQASILDEETVVFGMADGRAYMVNAVDDADCLAAFPMVNQDVSRLLADLAKQQRSECLSAIKELQAPASEQNLGAKARRDLSDPVVRARMITYVRTICPEQGIPVPDDLE